jgi:hypothetical protein
MLGVKKASTQKEGRFHQVFCQKALYIDHSGRVCTHTPGPRPKKKSPKKKKKKKKKKKRMSCHLAHVGLVSTLICLHLTNIMMHSGHQARLLQGAWTSPQSCFQVNLEPATTMEARNRCRWPRSRPPPGLSPRLACDKPVSRRVGGFAPSFIRTHGAC